MKNLSLKNILSSVGGKYTGDPDLLFREIDFITTDSRQAGQGCLFAAIRGENSDGHDYISAAFEAGALCVLAQHLPEGGCAGPVIEVPDTLWPSTVTSVVTSPGQVLLGSHT